MLHHLLLGLVLLVGFAHGLILTSPRTTIAIPASLAARALIFASLIDVLAFHGLDYLLRLLRLEMIE